MNFKHLSLKPDNYSNPQYLGSPFRRKRFKFFEDHLSLLKKPVTILDIGGTVRFWVNENYHLKDVEITVVNLHPQVSVHKNIKVIEGDACDLFLLKNNSFDVVFSNSLIEHLYTKENQLKMANEAMRVGKYFFIQTPNRYFPIEPHFKFPFFQFLPKTLQVFLQVHTSLINGVRYDRNYAENIVDEIRLLSRSEMLELFPKGDLHVERFGGLAKSFVLYRFPKQETLTN